MVGIFYKILYEGVLGEDGCEYVGSGQCENQVVLQWMHPKYPFQHLPEQWKERQSSQI